MRFSLPLFVVPLLAFSGCLSPKDPSVDNKPEGSATPKECFEALKAAEERQDWGAFHDQVDPADRGVALSVFILVGTLTAVMDQAATSEFNALLKKHGVREDEDGEEPTDEIDELKKTREMMKRKLKDVKDWKALFVEILTFIEEQNKKGGEDGFIMTRKSDLENLREEGGVATGELKSTKKSEAKPIQFVKREDRWYLGFSGKP